MDRKFDLETTFRRICNDTVLGGDVTIGIKRVDADHTAIICSIGDVPASSNLIGLKAIFFMLASYFKDLNACPTSSEADKQCIHDAMSAIAPIIDRVDRDSVSQN